MNGCSEFSSFLEPNQNYSGASGGMHTLSAWPLHGLNLTGPQLFTQIKRNLPGPQSVAVRMTQDTTG